MMQLLEHLIAAELLQSQYDTLEPLAADERGIRVSVTAAPDKIVDLVLTDYRTLTAADA